MSKTPVKYIGQVQYHLLSDKETEAGSSGSFNLSKVTTSRVFGLTSVLHLPKNGSYLEVAVNYSQHLAYKNSYLFTESNQAA